MNVKISIIIMSLAVIPVSAQGSDILEDIEPINRVTSCSWFERGYIKLPGLNTCLAIGGRLRGDVISGNLNEVEKITKPSVEKKPKNIWSDYQSYIQSRISVQTKTPMEFLTFSSYSGFEYKWSPEANDVKVEAEKAYIDLSGNSFSITAGLNQSIYTGFEGYSWIDMGGRLWADEKPLQAAFNVVSGPFNFGLAIEDLSIENYGSSYSRQQFRSTGDLAYIGAVKFASDVFDMKISGALIDLGKIELVVENGNGLTYEFNDQEKYGYAVNVNSELRPFDYLTVGFGVQYGISALRYTGFDLLEYQVTRTAQENHDILGYAEFFESNDYAVAEHFFNYMGAESFSINGGFSIHLLQDVFFNFDTSYQNWNVDHEFLRLKGEGIAANGSLIWKPISEVGIAFTAGYSSYLSEGGIFEGQNAYPLKDELNNFKIGTRVQYTFNPS